MTSAPLTTQVLEMHPSLDDQVPFDLAYRLNVAVWVFDIDNKSIVRANAAACDMWQAKDEAELQARDFASDMSVTVEKRLKQCQADFERNDSKFTELWTLYPNGEPKGLMVMFSGFRLADGRMGMQCETVADADSMPQNLRSAEALVHTDVMITLFSKDGPPLYLNPAARNAFGGLITDLVEIFDEPQACDHLLMQVELVGEHRQVLKMKTALGTRWHDISAKSCLDSVTGAPAILMTAIDVSDLKEARDTARYLADRDQLTNVYNRAYLQTQLAGLQNTLPNTTCALVFFDVDRFKLINDRHGHEAGDTVLKQIATRSRATLNAGDLIARLGGDEFVVLIKGVTDRVELNAKISMLRRAIRQPIVHDKTRVDVTVSVGVSTFVTRAGDLSDVLREADIALYAAKQAGRDCVTHFTPTMGAAVKAREQLEIELKQAVQEQQFVLYYQPRLDIKTGRIIGAEGLVRWHHPTRGIIAPGAFISICEEIGLIEDLGRQVLEMGCAQAIEWQKSGRDLNISLNVSPRQFSDPDFIQTLMQLSELRDFPRGKVELEITENVLIGESDRIAERLRSITEMGYSIAIDDFGTGYSNLSYISRFPLTCLKIDRSFVMQLPKSGPIVQLILTLGQQVGASVVSEGVETEEQLRWLVENRCDEAQGFFITKPLPRDAFERFIDNPDNVRFQSAS